MKKVLALILALVMMMSLNACGTSKEDHGKVINSGECGENVEWTYYEDCTLVFSGSGEIKEYYDDIWYVPDDVKLPWYVYSQQAQSIVIEEGITNIPAFAFLNCKVCKEIEIPNSVNKIGYCAFQYFPETPIVLPNSINEIKAMAFMYCDGDVYYSGTKAEFDKISKPEYISDSEFFSNYKWNERYDGKVVYYSEEETDNCWRYVEGIPTIW